MTLQKLVDLISVQDWNRTLQFHSCFGNIILPTIFFAFLLQRKKNNLLSNVEKECKSISDSY